MIVVKVKNGIPHINGRRCSYATKEIRTEIKNFSEVNEEFVLPKKYTYEITKLGGLAKIKEK